MLELRKAVARNIKPAQTFLSAHPPGTCANQPIRDPVSSCSARRRCRARGVPRRRGAVDMARRPRGVGLNAWEEQPATRRPRRGRLSVLGAAELFSPHHRRRAPLILAALLLALAPVIAWEGYPSARLSITVGSGFNGGRVLLTLAFACFLIATAVAVQRSSSSPGRLVLTCGAALACHPRAGGDL